MAVSTILVRYQNKRGDNRVWLKRQPHTAAVKKERFFLFSFIANSRSVIISHEQERHNRVAQHGGGDERGEHAAHNHVRHSYKLLKKGEGAGGGPSTQEALLHRLHRPTHTHYTKEKNTVQRNIIVHCILVPEESSPSSLGQSPSQASNLLSPRMNFCSHGIYFICTSKYHQSMVNNDKWKKDCLLNQSKYPKYTFRRRLFDSLSSRLD